jgi:hypothetical protein
LPSAIAVDWSSRITSTRAEDLERRLAAVEQRLGMEAGLRASGDRDIADIKQTLRAQHHTIQALAITQSEHTEKLDRLETGMSSVRGTLDQIVGMLDRLTERGKE